LLRYIMYFLREDLGQATRPEEATALDIRPVTPQLSERKDLQLNLVQARARDNPSVFAGFFIETKGNTSKSGSYSRSCKDEIEKAVR
jgi:hypothetical protein